MGTRNLAHFEMEPDRARVGYDGVDGAGVDGAVGLLLLLLSIADVVDAMAKLASCLSVFVLLFVLLLSVVSAACDCAGTVSVVNRGWCASCSSRSLFARAAVTSEDVSVATVFVLSPLLASPESMVVMYGRNYD